MEDIKGKHTVEAPPPGTAIDRTVIAVYCLTAGIVFFASFRAPNAEAMATSYSVPSYIRMLQQLSLPIVVLCAVIALYITFVYKHTTGVNRSKLLIYYYIFYLIVIASELPYGGVIEDVLMRVAFATVIFLFFYFVISPLPLYNASRYHVLNAFFIGAYLFLLLNVFLHQTGLGSLSWKGRFLGLTTHPNFIGMCGSVTTALSFGLFYREKSWLPKAIYLSGVVLGLWVCLLSVSRTSMLGAFVSIVIILFFSIKNNAVKPLLFLLVLLSGVLAVSYVDIQSLDYANRGNTREETWASMYEEASKLPFFGRGRSGATTNAYLFAIVAGGVFGAFFFFRTIVAAIAVFFTENLTKHSGKIALCGITGLLLVTSMFEGYLLDAAGVPVFAYWMILCYMNKA